MSSPLLIFYNYDTDKFHICPCIMHTFKFRIDEFWDFYIQTVTAIGERYVKFQ